MIADKCHYVTWKWLGWECGDSKRRWLQKWRPRELSQNSNQQRPQGKASAPPSLSLKGGFWLFIMLSLQEASRWFSSPPFPQECWFCVLLGLLNSSARLFAFTAHVNRIASVKVRVFTTQWNKNRNQRQASSPAAKWSFCNGFDES